MPEQPRVYAPRQHHDAPDARDYAAELNPEQLAAATHGEVYGEVRVESADDRSAAGVVKGEAVDPARHELRFDVKGATYHALHYQQSDGRWSARVILDL